MVFKATDQASGQIGQIGKLLDGFGNTLKKAAGAVGLYLGTREIIRFAKESLEAFGQIEDAVNDLGSAYDLIGKSRTLAGPEIKPFAEEMERTTRYTIAQVMEMAAVGARVGKLSGDELKEAIKAAMGLAKAYGTDVVGAMETMSRAREGVTRGLSQFGIKIKEGTSGQDAFNMALEKGHEKFKLVTDDIYSYNAFLDRMKDKYESTKRTIGEGLWDGLKWAAGPGLIPEDPFAQFKGQDLTPWITELERVQDQRAALRKSINDVINPASIAGMKEWHRKFDLPFQESAADPARRKIIDQLNDLRETISNFGKGENRILIEDMIGAGFSELQIDEAQFLQGRKSYLEKTQSVTEAIRAAVGDLRGQIAEFGRGAMESTLAGLREVGATAEQLAPVEALTSKLRDLQNRATTPPKLAWEEHRFLTFQAGQPGGRTLDYGQQTAKNTAEHIKIQKESFKVQMQMLKALERAARKEETFAETRFID